MNTKYRAVANITGNVVLSAPFRDDLQSAVEDVGVILDKVEMEAYLQSQNADGTWETLDEGMVDKLKEQGE